MIYLDSEHWRNLVGSRADLATSSLALPEFRSALRQKVMHGFLKPRRESVIWREFHRAIQTSIIRTFPLGSDVVDEAVDILDHMPRKLALRALDSLHLATARLIQCSALATTDLRMRAGAEALAIDLA
jgi:predicted nucleic acid-binding protein